VRVGDRKPYIPIFVGSTFTDLQMYRRAVAEALDQLEVIVKGMEHFGSKPGSPVEESLRVVASCKYYIGIFGMRYGTVPDRYDLSMTHLEYDEAQRQGLPSLIYILDEENQPILPKYVETGPGAEKLRVLKEQLKKYHTVSFFTTPESLRARILYDVPTLLAERGEEVSEKPDFLESSSDIQVLQQFKLLPKIFAGRQVIIEFVKDGAFRAADADECTALGLEIGASVLKWVKLSTGSLFYVAAEQDIAIALCQWPNGRTIRARAGTTFGTYLHVDWTEDGPISSPQMESGLVVKEILA
jgi:hypothetical protein